MYWSAKMSSPARFAVLSVASASCLLLSGCDKELLSQFQQVVQAYHDPDDPNLTGDEDVPFSGQDSGGAQNSPTGSTTSSNSNGGTSSGSSGNSPSVAGPLGSTPVAASATGCRTGKTRICHRTGAGESRRSRGGSCGGRHHITLCVSQSSVSAHQGHGDTLGSCRGGDDEDDD